VHHTERLSITDSPEAWITDPPVALLLMAVGIFWSEIIWVESNMACIEQRRKLFVIEPDRCRLGGGRDNHDNHSIPRPFL
jgi:hypothetical protein